MIGSSYGCASCRWLRFDLSSLTTKTHNLQPFYAMKTNSDEAILHTLATLGAGFDCASKEEIDTVCRFFPYFLNACRQQTIVDNRYGRPRWSHYIRKSVQVELFYSSRRVEGKIRNCDSMVSMQFLRELTWWRSTVLKSWKKLLRCTSVPSKKYQLFLKGEFGILEDNFQLQADPPICRFWPDREQSHERQVRSRSSHGIHLHVLLVQLKVFFSRKRPCYWNVPRKWDSTWSAWGP